MPGILELTSGYPRRAFAAGQTVIEQGVTSPAILVLIEGEVEVVRDGVRLARSSEPGAVFGEISALLGGIYTASVRTLTPSVFAVIEDSESFLAQSTEASLHVARLLARRINALNKYLVDVKRQYEGHDHLGMVDEVLDTLMNRPQGG
ncbi:MAG: cyclic nucleotide-binding domain-containing protein [Verrucomicrobia bacterium]|jgi:CRP-like cAMP-binding protein|nr:cyclic nucleotide-binding domain-containing protein [Verrucomicrobiota bacterium]